MKVCPLYCGACTGTRSSRGPRTPNRYSFFSGQSTAHTHTFLYRAQRFYFPTNQQSVMCTPSNTRVGLVCTRHLFHLLAPRGSIRVGIWDGAPIFCFAQVYGPAHPKLNLDSFSFSWPIHGAHAHVLIQSTTFFFFLTKKVCRLRQAAHACAWRKRHTFFIYSPPRGSISRVM